MMEDCQKKQLGNRKFPSPREDLIRSRRAKLAKARRERRPLTSGQTVIKIHRLMRKPSSRLQVSSLVPSGKSYKSGNLCANAVDAELGERIELTTDSGCAACALPVSVASTIRMQELNRTPQEYIAANAEKIRELGFKTPTHKISEC